MASDPMDMGDLIEMHDALPIRTLANGHRHLAATSTPAATALDSDGEATDEDTPMRNTYDLYKKPPKLEPFVPPPPTRPRHVRYAPPPRELHDTDRYYRPHRPRYVSVPHAEFQRYIEWRAAYQSNGWTAEDRFLSQNRNWQPSRGYLDEMADDRRHGGNYNRGYGGGGGRKRKFYGADDDDGYDRSRNRRDMARAPPLADRVRDQLFNMADWGVRNPTEDCYDLASLIASNEDDSRMIDGLVNNVSLLVTEQPMKIPHTVAIVRHLNEKKPQLVGRILDKAHQTAQAAIDSGDWRKLKLMLRFYAMCLPMLEGGAGLVALLDELFGRASDLQMASAEDAMGLELVRIIQLTVPYIVVFGGADLEKPISDLLEKTDIIASAPNEDVLSINPYMSAGTEQAPQLPQMVTMLQTQLRNEAEKGYPLHVVPRIYDEYFDTHKREAAEDEANGESKAHAFPPLAIPTVLPLGSRTYFPEVFFSLYADQDVETVPPTTDLSSSIIRDICVDTINLLDFNRERAVKYLIDLDNYFPRGTFAERGTPFDRLREAATEGDPTWKPEDLLMDAIFSQLMCLPGPEHKLVYYHSCVTYACREAAATIAPSLGRAIRFLYRSLDVLDLELGYRFMDWFSHHLSNYDFRWKWQEWADDVDRSPLHPRNAFIRGVLDKEIRLSFARRIRESLPEAYEALVPESKDNDIPPFKYNNHDTPFSEEGRAILAAIRNKQPDTDIVPTLTSIEESAATNGQSRTAAIDAYVTSLCCIGSKSLSHALSYIERCRHRLVAFSDEAANADLALQARTQIIDSVVAYWRDTQAGVAVNIVDKLLNYSILSPAAVVAWALGAGELPAETCRADTTTALPEAWMYEMVASTVRKVTNRVRQIFSLRLTHSLPAEQLAQLDATLESEAADMNTLFAAVDAALARIAEPATNGNVGAADAPGPDAADDADDTPQLQRWWGARWRRVFARKREVEQRVMRDARARFPGPAPDGDGDATANGDGDAMRIDEGAAPQANGDDAGSGAQDV